MLRSGSVILPALSLVALGLLAGGAHSWHTPVHLRLQQPASEPRVPPSDPAPDGTPTATSTSTPTPTVTPAPAPEALGLHITVAQAKSLFDQGIVFVDARPDREYLAGAIPGAQHITPVSFTLPETTERLRFLDPGAPLVIYCGGGDCHDSENLAILFQQSGYKAIHILTDGLPGWKNAGHEVEVPAGSGA